MQHTRTHTHYPYHCAAGTLARSLARVRRRVCATHNINGFRSAHSHTQTPALTIPAAAAAPQHKRRRTSGGVDVGAATCTMRSQYSCRAMYTVHKLHIFYINYIFDGVALHVRGEYAPGSAGLPLRTRVPRAHPNDVVCASTCEHITACRCVRAHARSDQRLGSAGRRRPSMRQCGNCGT